MTVLRASLLSVFALGLVACGSGGKLSFETPDAAIKSYTKAVKGMDTAERNTFNRNIILLAATEAGESPEQALGKWKAATLTAPQFETLFQEAVTAERFTPEQQAFIDGQSVGDINARGDAYRRDILSALEQETQDKLSALKAAEKTLLADIDQYYADYKAAAKAERGRISKMKKYKAEASIDNVVQFSNVTRLSGTLSLRNPHRAPIQNVTAFANVTYGKHTSREEIDVSFEGLAGGETQSEPVTLSFLAMQFLDKNADALPVDTELPADIDAYDVTILPVRVTTQDSRGKVTIHNHDVDKTDRAVLTDISDNVAMCKVYMEQVAEITARYNERLAVIKTGDLDEIDIVRFQDIDGRC